VAESFLKIAVEGQPDLEKVIEGLPAALDTKRILDEGAAVLFNNIRTRFLQEVDPQGQPWEPSKAALDRAKFGIGGGTLFASGKLFRSLQLYAIDENSRAIGTNATSEDGFPYPILFQYGLGGQTQRQFLGFSSSDIEYMHDLVFKRLTEQLGEL